jgi:hypothetical protein
MATYLEDSANGTAIAEYLERIAMAVEQIAGVLSVQTIDEAATRERDTEIVKAAKQIAEKLTESRGKTTYDTRLIRECCDTLQSILGETADAT